MSDSSTAFSKVTRLLSQAEFEPDEIAGMLTEMAVNMRYDEMIVEETRLPGGLVEYNQFRTEFDRQWLDDQSLTFFDNDYNVIVPLSINYDEGIITFTAGQITDTMLPVTVIGTSHDPYGSAANLLIQQAESMSGDPSSFSVLNGSFTYQESQRKGPLEMAKMYRKQARIVVAG